MRILIYGAGAVGCYLGGHLALAGHTITLLGREPLKAVIEDSGLTLLLADGSPQTVDSITAETDPASALKDKSYDWIAFTMRAYDTVPAIFELQAVEPSPPPIVCFQNGIGNEESLRSAFGPDQVVAATLTSPVSMPTPGVVIEEKARGIGLASDSPASARVEGALQETRLPTKVVPRSDVLKWSKLLLNMVGNATAAILDMPPEEVLADPLLFGIEWAALREALYIMDLSDISVVNLPGAAARTLSLAIRYVPQPMLRPLLRQRVETGRGDKLPSLLKALRSGQRRTEVAWLNGAVVQAADRLKRLAPVNHALALTVADIAAGRVDWDAYRRNPEALLTVIRAAQGLPA
jgi:2-dehydropantoate 2-reductase